MAKLISTNPSKNYEVIGEMEVSSEEEIINKVKKAKEAAESWGELSVKERVCYLKKVYQIFESHREELGKLVGNEIGMPVSVRDTMEIGAGLDYFKWYLENAEKCLAPEITHEDKTSKSTVYYEPIGVAVVISPWNFPFCNFIWGVMPNLFAGNTVIFKHSEECPFVGKKIDELISKCSLPEGVFTEVYGDGKIGDFLVHQDIDLINFTGSTKVGQYLYKIAAEKFIKISLELGGSAPGIIFADADIDRVIETVYFARFYNSGQVCDGLKRLLVHQSKYDEVLEKLSQVLKNKKVGDPNEPNTDMGPLVAQRQLDLLKDQTEDSLKQNAKVFFETKFSPNLKGAFYPPKILIHVKTSMRVWREEVFGPVLPVVSFKTEKEAVALANDTDYGLGGYIYTENKTLAEKAAAKLKTGMVAVNNTTYINPANPWGGYKKSGIGRGNGKFGLHEASLIKIVTTEK